MSDRMRVRVAPVDSLGHMRLSEYYGFVHAMNGDSTSMLLSPLVCIVVKLPCLEVKDV